MPKIKNKNLSLVIIPIILLAVVLAALLTYSDSTEKKAKTVAKTTSNSSSDACGPYRKDLIVSMKGQDFNTEEVKTVAEAAKGLGGRPCILPNQAMLFVYTQAGQYPFWMKGMKFPIDMIWISSDRKVAWAYRNVSPATYPNKYSNPADHPAQYVLETKANTITKLNLQLDDPVQFKSASAT